MCFEESGNANSTQTHANFEWMAKTTQTISFLLELYLEILVLDAKALTQVPEDLRAVLFEFKLPWEILSERQITRKD